MIDFVIFIGLLCLTWLIVEGAEPIQFFKRLTNIDNASNPKGYIQIFFQQLLNCALCTGFWVGLIYYQNIVLGCLVSVFAEIFYRLLLALLQRWLP